VGGVPLTARSLTDEDLEVEERVERVSVLETADEVLGSLVKAFRFSIFRTESFRLEDPADASVTIANGTISAINSRAALILRKCGI
ncbi:MAG: hypothetical protein KDD42_04350, partial [Bdellovibrionales bacterium]|nr:hypothetical protein [Bdellovibrionales bacterium]